MHFVGLYLLIVDIVADPLRPQPQWSLPCADRLSSQDALGAEICLRPPRLHLPQNLHHLFGKVQIIVEPLPRLHLRHIKTWLSVRERRKVEKAPDDDG